MKEPIEGKTPLLIYLSKNKTLQQAKYPIRMIQIEYQIIKNSNYNIQFNKNKGSNQIISIGRQDMIEYQDIINHINQQQFQVDTVTPEIERLMRKKMYLQSDETNMYEDEMFAEMDGERIDKSGNTYQDFMEYEDIFNSSGQVNYDRKKQIEVNSNYNSNNTNGKKQNYDKKEKNSKQQEHDYLMMMYDGIGIDCDICINKVNLNKFVQQQLDVKYFEKFNFYFAKGINEILANLNISHVILFKDYLFYDDDSEYLKRYYQSHEILPRFNLLSDFYANQYKETRPNLCIVSPNKIINKRNYKQAKLFIQNQERLYQQNEQEQENGNREQVQYNNNINIGNNDHPEDQHVLSPSLTKKEIKNQPNPISNFLYELDSNYINASDQNTQNNQNKESWSDIKQQNSNQNKSKNVHQQEHKQIKNGSFMEDFYRFDQENSFDSKSHNIYSPQYTSENESSSSINKDPSQLLKHLTKNEKASYKNCFKNEYNNDFKVDFNDDIFVSNPNIRQRGNFVSTIKKISNNGQVQLKVNNSNNNLIKNNNYQQDKNIHKSDNKNNIQKDNNILVEKSNNFADKNLESLQNSGQLTPKYLYQYNELEDIENQMPSYLKVYVEECNNMSFSQPQKQSNSIDMIQQIAPINLQQAEQLKQLQTLQLQQQIQQLQQQHISQSSVNEDKQNKNQQIKYQYVNGQMLPITQNSQEVKDNRFKLPLQKLQGNANNGNTNQLKQAPLSARNHEEAYEDLRKKIAQHQKMMLKQNEENSINREQIVVSQLVTGQQINDLTSNSSTQNQHQQFLNQHKISSQNPSSNGLNQNSINIISTDQNLPDQQYDEFLSVIATPKEFNHQQMLQYQQQQKTAGKNNQPANTKQPLQVEVKQVNNYDYLLKENRIQGGISDPHAKLNYQQNQQYQQNAPTLQIHPSQQHASQVSSQQKKQNSLLNRLPQNIKQQLALNLQENEQLQKNIRLNQNQQSPDRIWTDRDVNPRLAANPQKLNILI